MNLSTGRTIVDPNWERTPEERKVCQALERVAAEVGTKSITAGAFLAVTPAKIIS